MGIRDNLSEYHKQYYKTRRIERKSQIRERQRQIKQEIQAYKLSLGCSLCGYKKSAKALHFHHKDEDKLHSVGRMCAQGRSMISIFKEIDKCVLVCANCHAELHDGGIG